MSAFTPLRPRSSFFRQPTPWNTCRQCLRNQARPHRPSGFTTKTTPPNAIPKPKRRRRAAFVVGGIGAVTAAVALNDDARHAFAAVQRSGRVAATLFLCIAEYVGSLSSIPA